MTRDVRHGKHRELQLIIKLICPPPALHMIFTFTISIPQQQSHF